MGPHDEQPAQVSIAHFRDAAQPLLAAGRGLSRCQDPVVLSIEAKLRRAGKGKRLIIAKGANAEVNQGLVELIKEAFAIRNQLLSGSDDSIEAMSARIGSNKFRLTSLIRLSYLAPASFALFSRAGIPSRSRRPGSCG
jgi:site-specific DNA recombinase